MNEPLVINVEDAAAIAFNKQAVVFDKLYGSDAMTGYKRERVRNHVCKYLSPGSHILELNAGTGEDAIFFARQGHKVHATDISTEMQQNSIQKTWQYGLHERISHEICSFNHLEKLSARGPYDLLFSNFAGLNCTPALGKVLQSMDELVKPGGLVTLVLLPKFCLWEVLMLFRGKFKTALRRFSGSKGARAHIDGVYFRCWYYNPSFVRKHLPSTFSVVGLEGMNTWLPPSYLTLFEEKYPKLYRFLERNEDRYRYSWPWRNIGDYYIITLRKN